jgi:hypothetical protein
MTRYSLVYAFEKLSTLDNIFDVFALLHYVCKEKYAVIYDSCYIGDWGEFCIDWQKRAADILPPKTCAQ